MINHIISVDKNHLLPIFAGADIIQPYRCQPNLKILVAYEEYVNFVKDMVRLSINWLNLQMDKYQNGIRNLSNNGNAILGYYYYDLSIALMNEIKLACEFDSDATLISHSFGTGAMEKTLSQLYEDIPDSHLQSALRWVGKTFKGYSGVSEHNMQLIRYATVLRAMSLNVAPYKFEIK